MSSPVILDDLGDGVQRRFFLGADELRIIKRETGRGFWALYKNFEADADPDEVYAIVRLALIGGGMAPKDALELSDYYCRPPRPLKQAYVIAYKALCACWSGAYTENKSTGRPLTAAEMDTYFIDLEAALLKAGWDTSVLKGKSFAEIQDLMAALSGKEAAAPDADMFAAMKASVKKTKRAKP